MAERGLRTFDHFPENFKCPICDGNRDKECFLMPLDGTAKGNIEEAVPVHVECMNINKFRFNRASNLIYLIVETP